MPPAAGTAVMLDWSDRAHWSPLARPCRHCGRVTNLRDDEGEPAHKVCAERHADPAPARRDAPAPEPAARRDVERAVECVICGEPATAAPRTDGAYCATCALF
ncbi:hypothetical protein ABH926_008938 [Catenulispora sp. GP43]|uniref:hypothetical protein n=1 Tax=Catenulispora sp. GP43 TaxID=3156263 RepID=UPI003512F298